MSIELMLLLGLLAIFVVPILTDINVGLVAFVAAMLLGSVVLDLSMAAVLSGFPAQMFILIVGVTLLLAIAERNGTIDWVVGALMQLSRGQLIVLPAVLYVTAFVTSSLGPGSAPVLFAIGAGLIGRFQLNPLLVGAMIIYGTQSGAYSPIAPYGVVIRQLATDLGIVYSPVLMYAGVAGFYLALTALLFVVLGGVKLRGQTFSGAAMEIDRAAPATARRYLTLGGFALMLVLVVVLGAHLGFVALSIAFVLLLSSDRAVRSEAVNQVAWPIVLVVTGVLTYVNMLQQAGVIDWLAEYAGQMGSPDLVGLLLAYLVALVTGVASTVGTIGLLVPLAAPMITTGALDGTALLTTMAVAAAVSDISPFSTWGALFLATVAAVANRERLLRKQIVMTLALVAAVPAVAWACFLLARG